MPFQPPVPSLTLAVIATLAALAPPSAEAAGPAGRDKGAELGRRLFSRETSTCTDSAWDADGSFGWYDLFRARIRGEFPAGSAAAEARTALGGGLSYRLARRNTPALFGAGLLDQIPTSLLLEVTASQAERSPTVAGRPAFEGRGRFGWRGQTATLDGFVRNACEAELGLRVPPGPGGGDDDQAVWPLPGPLPSAHKKAALDLLAAQVAGLVAFVRSLPASAPVAPADPAEAADAEEGRRLFAEVGCAACHVEHLGRARHVYSDLLLHDMGPELADRVAAPRPPRVITVTESEAVVEQSPGVPGGSYGGGGGGPQVSLRERSRRIVIPPSLGELELATREWRTPPLWGVADSAPYLHDGRAATLDEAIRGHGGQGAATADRYAASEPGRRAVLAFLATLKAPPGGAGTFGGRPSE